MQLEAGEALTIVSFDDSPQRAEQEEHEGRSLNLALRRRKVRSEIIRVPQDPDAETVAMLEDFARSFAHRKVIILSRAAQSYPAQQRLIRQLQASITSCCVIAIVSDDSDDIESLATALTSKIVG